MSAVVSSHQLSAYTNPQAGQAGTASVVLGNDNTTVTGYNAHDADPTIHVQSSTLAARPAATATPGVVAGSLWFTSDGLRLYYSDGATWNEAAYLPLVGGAVTGAVSINASLSVFGASTTLLRVGLTTANPALTVDTNTALQVAGLKIVGAVTGGTVALVATDSGSAASVTLNALGIGTIGIGTVSTGLITLGSSVTITTGKTLTVTGVTVAGLTAASVGAGTFPAGAFIFGATTSTVVITSSSAVALTIGPNGATTPLFTVDASASTAVNGIKIIGAASGGDITLTTTKGGASDSRLLIVTTGSQNVDIGQSGGDVRFPNVGTTGSAANVNFGTSNTIKLVSSSLRYKDWQGALAVNAARAVVLALNDDSPAGGIGRGAGYYKSVCKGDNPNQMFLGFTAERAHEVCQALVFYNKAGEPDGFMYDRMTVVHNVLLGDHERRIAALEAA